MRLVRSVVSRRTPDAIDARINRKEYSLAIDEQEANPMGRFAFNAALSCLDVRTAR
jgi:hypothetical protein